LSLLIIFLLYPTIPATGSGFIPEKPRTVTVTNAAKTAIWAISVNFILIPSFLLKFFISDEACNKTLIFTPPFQFS
jgi:hypothetical protein